MVLQRQLLLNYMIDGRIVHKCRHLGIWFRWVVQENDRMGNVMLYLLNQCLGAYLGFISSLYYKQDHIHVICYTVIGALSSVCFPIWLRISGLIVATCASFVSPALGTLIAVMTAICIEIFIMYFALVACLIGIYYAALLYKGTVS